MIRIVDISSSDYVIEEIFQLNEWIDSFFLTISGNKVFQISLSFLPYLKIRRGKKREKLEARTCKS